MLTEADIQALTAEATRGSALVTADVRLHADRRVPGVQLPAVAPHIGADGSGEASTKAQAKVLAWAQRQILRHALTASDCADDDILVLGADHLAFGDGARWWLVHLHAPAGSTAFADKLTDAACAPLPVDGPVSAFRKHKLLVGMRPPTSRELADYREELRALRVSEGEAATGAPDLWGNPGAHGLRVVAVINPLLGLGDPCGGAEVAAMVAVDIAGQLLLAVAADYGYRDGSNGPIFAGPTAGDLQLIPDHASLDVALEQLRRTRMTVMGEDNVTAYFALLHEQLTPYLGAV